MQSLHKWFWGVLAFAMAAASGSAATKTEAKLLLDSDAARPGDTVIAALQMKMPNRWHTYWRNSGDSGGPTDIAWQLPEGITAGAIQWPVPEKFTVAGLTTYVYHDTVLLRVPLTISKSMSNGPVQIAAKASWLECTADLCLKGRANLQAGLTIGAEQKKSSSASLIAEWQKKLPDVTDSREAQAAWDKGEADQRNLLISWNLANKGAEPDFFPFESKGYEILTKTENAGAEGGKARIRKGVKKLEGDWPSQIAGLLVEKTGSGTKAFQVQIPIGQTTAGAAASAPAATPSGSSGGFRAAASDGPSSFWGALGLAFLGGLILNIMPCVLPVISLKILGFVQQSQQSPGAVRRLGLIYVAGVLASFAAIAVIAIAVGKTAVWGSQFQDPRFVVIMATLMTLVALNLFGIFEVALPGSTMGAASDLAGSHGARGAFFNGLLATALATSCTAPIMTVALGFALATPRPPFVILSIFLMMGLGLAVPYLILSWNPRLLRFLPKPGAWMEKFKMAMGFPMLATALWLLSLTSAHFGNRGPLWVGLFLLFVAFAAWVWGEFLQRSSQRRGLALAAVLVLLGVGYGWCLERELTWRGSRQYAGASTPGTHEAGAIDWQPWNADAVQKARAEGHPVLVDFTADWCLTCQANKRSSLEIASVRSKLKETNAVAFIADFTLEDPLIAAELKRFNRAGVPLVVVYPKNPGREPLVLPSLLTPSIVLGALDDAAK